MVTVGVVVVVVVVDVCVFLEGTIMCLIVCLFRVHCRKENKVLWLVVMVLIVLLSVVDVISGFSSPPLTTFTRLPHSPH